MQKKKGEAPQYRTIKISIYVTPEELAQLDRLAEKAGCQRAVYIRTIALGQKLSDQPRAITIDDVRFSRIMGALGDTGSLLHEILALVRVGEMPFENTIDLLVSKIEMAADTINPPAPDGAE